MKKLLTILTLTAFAAAPATVFAAKKEAAAPAAPAAEAKPAAPTVVKPSPMNTKVDTIDAAAKTFTHTNKKDSKVVKFVVTATTEIMNGEAPAKFADIKVGDTVSGLRIKKSDTEYEVVKITKFGVVAPKEKKADAKKAAAAAAAPAAPVAPVKKAN